MTRLLAIDVGTRAARAGLFDAGGALLATASAGFALHRPHEHHAVYRMDEIWHAVCRAVREVRAATGHAPVAAMAFDATSSLALTAEGAPPLDGEADVLCWMDHRGEAEADEIAASGDRYLHYVGGTLSPEMHLPKLLWLRRHRPDAWARLRAVRDLCDELATRATGTARHSVCGLACKFPYLPSDAQPWRHALLDRLGLAALPTLGALSQRPGRVGERHGTVCARAAAELDLPQGVPVAIGLIDAEAGALGVLGHGYAAAMNRTITLIGGTSTSYMSWAAEERRIPGVWGPFRDAVFPGVWMHEAGQSLSGAALDALLDNHPGGPREVSAAGHADAARDILALLDAEGPGFAARRHLVPDWLGNRSPLGDGCMRALMTGLGEDHTRRAFLEQYYATARALALQSRHIIDHLNRHGYAIDRCALAGGHLRNPLLMRLYRDALGVQAVVSDAPEPVLLGTAMVAAVTAGVADTLLAALEAMAPRQTALPADPCWRAAHDAAYRIYLRLFDVRNEIERQSRAPAFPSTNAFPLLSPGDA